MADVQQALALCSLFSLLANVKNLLVGMPD